MRNASDSTAPGEKSAEKNLQQEPRFTLLQQLPQQQNLPLLPPIKIRKLRLVSGNQKKQNILKPLMQDLEVKLEGTTGLPVSNIARFSVTKPKTSEPEIRPENLNAPKTRKALATVRTKKIDLTKPPKLKGCKWIKTDDGWNLWRIKREKAPITGAIITKSRYAGSLSHDGWNVMKEYDYKTIVSIIADRISRYGKR